MEGIGPSNDALVLPPDRFVRGAVGTERTGGEWTFRRFLPGQAAAYREAGLDDFCRKTMEPVRDFEKRHGARIYVGEFSAITWAEGADSYLRDCIAVFEEFGWDWSYHAFREWNGWSVEHACEGPGRPFVPSADNPRKRALLEGFARATPRTDVRVPDGPDGGPR